MSTLALIQELEPTLSPVEGRVAAYFLSHAEMLTNTPILAVAQACGTGKSAVVRLCKRLGYSGYKEFLTVLSAELALKGRDEKALTDLFPDSAVGGICAIVAKNSISALENTLRLLDMDAMERASHAIADARRIDLYGVGNSGVIAQDAEIKFRRIGMNAYAPCDTHRQIISASTLEKGDAAMFFSYYGETKDILQAHAVAKAQGATTIALTRLGKSTLSAQADIVLSVAGTESLVRSGAMASRIVMLGVLDMLFTVVCSHHYERVRDILERTADAVREKRN